MSQKILVLSPCNHEASTLCDNLSSLGFAATSVETLVHPSAEEHSPALCIIDLQLHHSSFPALWDAWLQDCLQTRTACLAYDSTTQPEHSMIARLDPLCNTLQDPEDKDQLVGKIHSLLTIRKLTRQLEATRHQLAHYQEELQEALQSAAYIQRSLIPKRRPTYHNLSYAWRYMPCKQVGGDLFNVVQLDEQTVMTYLMDVSGHGISSAMVTVSVHQSLSIHTGQLVKRPTDQPPFYEITSPARVLKELEAEYPFERFEEFFTISYMLINPHTGHLRYSNGGHPPPLLLRKDGSVERLEAGGTVIGIGEKIAFEEGETRLLRGDRLFMYTDGITEHCGASDEAFGEERFIGQLCLHKEQPLDEVTRDALIAMREFGGSTLPIDDVTLIGIEFT